jgi:hypothetical protein
MQGVGLLISLQQLKMKVAKLTQIRPQYLFEERHYGPLGGRFKRRHLELNICQVEGLDINQT